MTAYDVDAVDRFGTDRRLSRRAAGRAAVGLVASGLGAIDIAQAASAQDTATPAASDGNDRAAAIVAMAREVMARADLRAVIVRVTIGGEEVVTDALGESLTGVPATTEMHFRNGSVAISYVTTLLLHLVDRGIVGLDAPLATWLPSLRHADRITLRMLANMTAGYPDYVQDEGFVTALYADPFRQWAPEELVAISLASPHLFEPGTNWGYAHSNIVILGQTLEAITGTPMATLMRENIFDPLGLYNTHPTSTAAIPEPVLHAFSSERRTALGIPPTTRFYEESTYWNPSWTLAQGTIQTTNIYDMTTTAEAIGTGALLSPESHRAQVSPNLIGFGTPVEGCATCTAQTEAYNYGLGLVRSGSWILQNPLFGGYGAIEAYLPSQKIAIAVATTFGEQSFGEQGELLHPRASWDIFAAIAAYLAPDEAPPPRRPAA